MTNPLPIGLVVPPFGKIKAVWEWHGGRYYWMANERGLELMRAQTVERGKEVINEQS